MAWPWSVPKRQTYSQIKWCKCRNSTLWELMPIRTFRKLWRRLHGIANKWQTRQRKKKQSILHMHGSYWLRANNKTYRLPHTNMHAYYFYPFYLDGRAVFNEDENESGKRIWFWPHASTTYSSTDLLTDWERKIKSDFIEAKIIKYHRYRLYKMNTNWTYIHLYYTICEQNLIRLCQNFSDSKRRCLK